MDLHGQLNDAVLQSNIVIGLNTKRKRTIEMKVRKTSWKKRMIAIVMAASMLVTMTSAVLAEGDLEQYVPISGSEIIGEEIDNSVDGSGIEDNVSDTDIAFETEENEVPEDGSVESQTEEDTDSEDFMEESSEIELCLSLLSADSGDTQSPTLTLEQAINLANLYYENSSEGIENPPISRDDQSILNIYNGEGLILLSNVVPKDYADKTLNLITTTSWDLTGVMTITETSEEGGTANSTDYYFLGLGDSENPFCGAFQIDITSTTRCIQTGKSLFNAISANASLPSNINFIIDSNNATMNDPLLAEQVIAGNEESSLICTVSITSDSVSGIIGGMIGTLGANAKASVNLVNNSSGVLTINGAGDTGLICNVMKEDSSLKVGETNSGNAGIIVSATSGNAGGFVGLMESGSALTVSSGNSPSAVSATDDAGGFVGKMAAPNTSTTGGKSTTLAISNTTAMPTTITSIKGNAGGLVGSAQDAEFTIFSSEENAESETAATYSVSSATITAGSNKSAGGLVGEYTNTKSGGSINLGQYSIDVSLSRSANSYIGGVFGTLKSSNNYTINTSGTNQKVVSKLAGTSGAPSAYGGLIGIYNKTDSDLSEALVVQSLSIDSQSSTCSTNYGGVIGTLPDTCYVKLENLTVKIIDGTATSNFGGLVGKMGEFSSVMLDVGSVTLSSTKKIKWESNRTHGGLIGYLMKGVVRLSGTTDCSGLQFADTGEKRGQIVGQNEDGLVYAVGDGNGKYGNSTGWLLKRYDDSEAKEKNEQRNGSDIGNWGEVVRLDGSKLTEGDGKNNTDLIYFDEDKHTVTVKSSFGNVKDNTYAVSNTRDFAAYALAFNYAKVTADTVLKFETSVDPSVSQNVTLGDDIDLTNTGILGIGRDFESSNKSNCTYFFGSFDGGKNTVTLDIGGSYGVIAESTSEEGNGRMYVNGNNNILGHGCLALFACVGNNSQTITTTIKDVTVTGRIYLSVMNGQVGKSSYIDAAGLVAYQKGNVEYNNITSIVDIDVKNHPTNTANDIYVVQSGIVAETTDNSNTSFEECKWEAASASELSNNRSSDYNYIGGFLGFVRKKNKITVTNSTLSGTINASGSNNNYAKVGGLVAVTGQGSTISICGLSVEGENITTAAKSSSGGLLGYQWDKTDVTFGTTNENGSIDTGVTIKNSTLNAGSKAAFGGLVYQATGYWNATAAKSIVFETGTGTDDVSIPNSFTGKSINDTPSGLLVGTGLNGENNALYLEVGTWGSEGAAYYIAADAVDVKQGDSKAPTYFDELVGTTISNNMENQNAVVSLATSDHALIDTTVCNTYTGQLGEGINYKNSKSRYYYNLDSCRSANSDTGISTINAGSLNTPQAVLSWSVSQYAASNIREKFCKNPTTGASITGATNATEISLKGYSYYPVTPLSSVTVNNANVTFSYKEMNDFESAEGKVNKVFGDFDRQHYLMHCGLLYNTGNSVTVKKTTFKGTVGSDSTGSGALIFGSITGNTTTPNKISLNDVILDGLCVTGVNTDKISDTNAVTYAPLLINKIGEGVTLTVNGLSTGTGYTTGTETTYAATSLIGTVGDTTATKLTLTFSEIALDSRVTGTTTKVWNNGKSDGYEVVYNTYHTIFTKATLLDSFQYSSESSGSYIFRSTDDKVTYGYEISNTVSGRNLGEQYQYYDIDEYSWDGVKDKPTDETIAIYYGAGYLPYVRQSEPAASENADNYRELDINLRPAHLDTGCGTYGHPYQITDGKQLVALANFLERGTASGWVVCINDTVYEEQKQTEGGYHTTFPETGDTYYICEDDQWFRAVKENGIYSQTGAPLTSGTVDGMRAYLRNAYYMVTRDINIASNTYAGIGGSTIDKAFSGVIVGQQKEDNSYPTVYISTKNDTFPNFGGLVRFSQGSVIKNLNVSYAGGSINDKSVEAAGITISNSAPSSTSNNPFFGGVVGYCMGGDTIIDNVSVAYGMNTVTLNDSTNKGYDRLIAVGGYVGLVGGAVQTTGSSNENYEKTGGGVVFRYMGGRTNPFAGTMAANSGAGSAYYYCNPFVGRVLDGYACGEGCTVDNTDKNYTIPNLTAGTTDLVVDNNFSVTVNSEQGLWLLSAIVNSGAGAMDSTGTYQDVDQQYVEAYQYGKVRSASYEGIGTGDGNKTALLADEGVSLSDGDSSWGGVTGGGTSRISYLVKNYTGGISAAKLAGAQATGNNNPNNSVTLIISKDLDMSSYINGFRGIGGSYGNTNKNLGEQKYNWRRNLLVSRITGGSHEITLEMDQKVYYFENIGSDAYKEAWFNKGTGLFTTFMCTNACQVETLSLSGNVKFGYYDKDGNPTYAFGSDGNGLSACVGGFAGRMMNGIKTSSDSTAVIFNGMSLDSLNVGGVKDEGQSVVTGGAMYTGGVIGCVDSTAANSVTFNTWPLNSAKVATDGHSICYTGGLIGCYDGSGTLTVGPASNSNTENVKRWDVNASEITVYSRMEQKEAAGACLGMLVGNIGNSQVSTVIIQNTDFRDLKVDAIRTSNVGGLIGRCQSNNNLTIENVTLTDLTASSTNCQKGLDSTVDHSYYGLGGLIGCNAAGTTIDNVCIEGDSSIYSNYDGSDCAKPTVGTGDEDPKYFDVNVGGLIGNSELNGNKQTIINNCTIEGTAETPIRIMVYATKAGSNNGKCDAAGGFFGFDKMKNTIIKDSTLSYVNILAPVSPAALIGHKNFNGLNVCNINIDNCNVALLKANGNSSECYTGLVTGYTWSAIYGYNILVKSTNIGIFSTWGDSTSTSKDNLKSAIEVLDYMKYMNADKVGLYSGSSFLSYSGIKELNDLSNTKSSTIGTWIGQRGGTSNNDTKFVAVACDENCNTPITNLGTGGTQTSMSVIFADYSVDQTYRGSSADPWVDINPSSNVPVKDESGNTVILTGNGVGLTNSDETEEKSVAQIILEESKSTSSKKYYNLIDGNSKIFSQFLDNTKDVYLNSYQKEEGDATIVPSGTDFPILVVNSLADADTLIWNYIAAMTNVSSGTEAKTQATSVDAKICIWTANPGAETGEDGTIEGSFVRKSTSSSLNVSTSDKRTIAIVKGAYDNQKSQFTLLDVKYNDPTGNNSNGFHLYIPVLVKKVLYVNFSANFLAGTSYHASDYMVKKEYATAGFEEPVTAYIEYNYDRSKADWQSMLDNGENLLWYYDKNLNLANGSTSNGTTKLLPSGTCLTLVDRQTRQYYTYTFTDDDDPCQFALSKMLAPDGKTSFSPVPICDLLGLTVAEAGDVAGTPYVEESDITKATVKVGDTYYRKAGEGDEDAAKDKYIITLGSNLTSDTTGTNYLPRGEGYYLTIQIPATEGYSVVNNSLSFNNRVMTMCKGAPPAYIRTDTTSAYVIYDGVQQTFSITGTSRIHSNKEQLDTVMENGDSIKIMLKSTLSLTEAGTEFFSSLGPAELNHQFDINMIKYLKDAVGENTVIGSENAVYKYTVTGSGLSETINGTFQNSAGLDTLTIQYGSADLKTALQRGIVTITAEINLMYGMVGDYFPAKSASDTSDDSGISVAAASRIANSSSQLPITEKKETAENGKRYYTTNPSKASLTYFTIDGTGIGDSTQQLGINPSDEVNNLGNVIYTEADYDYSSVDVSALASAQTIQFTVELFQKQEDEQGNVSYKETSPLGRIGEYLPTVEETGGVKFTISTDTKSMNLKKQFVQNSTLPHTFVLIDFTPLTGSAFEEKEFTYANYKVRLTAVLLDKDGKEIDGTRASDYVIYTNARIYQKMINTGTDVSS